MEINKYNKNIIKDAFTVSPNPAKDILQVNGVNNQNFTKATIYDLTGKLIKTTTPSNNAINVQSLNKGMYILILDDANGKQFSVKFIKA